ncbi:MAG: putative oxygen-independent coproporphyrinogen III oxidase [Granulosicoccus sp.]|jgi:putative oxygen-independent coproporphyrinogen III oxidase
MAGLYIHIPFCKQACTYCDFHFTTNLAGLQNLVDAICKEIQLQKAYLQESELQTIYFGGGTPSLLSAKQLDQILSAIQSVHRINGSAEITLEANPDDLSSLKLKSLHSSGINRLSIGIQSLNEKVLKWMNRSHNVQQALDSVAEANSIGIHNISVDLIFGTSFTGRNLQKELDQFTQLGVRHISAYSLTVEPKTLLEDLIKKKKEKPLNPDEAAIEFLSCHDYLSNAGFDHYEVSNYALPSSSSIHNSSYWSDKTYLGIGPSAHSYNLNSRQWNVKSNAKYISQINKGEVPFEKESLNEITKLNELLMTGLRTSTGVSNAAVLKLGGSDQWRALLNRSSKYLKAELLTLEKDQLACSINGWLVLDDVLAELFFD